MSSFEKLVKLACKPKGAAPKSKYVDPLVSATYADDGSIHDICRALAPRFKEPNAMIVFKALIVLHSMIRQGQTDNVLKYLASSDVLRLRNVSNGQWDGYMAPQNIAHYAMYLDCRVRTYKDLKHDAIRVQSESNRDRSSADDDGPSARPLQRNKTVMGRKLRVMTVEKGLLRETKMVQRLTDSLLECKLYDDSLEDELNITSLRMLVKDLLVLFQAANEGVINVLEHYFEMSHVDAENALKIYQHFCKQTERVVNYLGIAKKLQNVLNVQIPNLRHAPVSLAKTLEEYIKDPNFEDNRLEYRNSRIIADGGSVSKKDEKAPETKPNPSVKIPENNTASSSTATESAKPGKSELMDFFSSIEQEQPSMFDPQSQSPTNHYFQQQSQFNPFLQRQMVAPQMTGMNGQQPFIQPQATGFNPNNPFPQQPQQPFLIPQATAVPFQAQPLQPQATAMPFIQPQQTAIPFLQPQDTARPFQPQQQQQPVSFLQPQMTGSNPFRQTILLPQTTGTPSNPFPSNPFPSNPFPSNPFPSNPGTPSIQPTATGTGPGIARPASTPIGGAERRPTIAALVPQVTGSRNPFGPVPAPPPPPVPKLPTLAELQGGAFSASFSSNSTGQNTNGASTIHTQPFGSGPFGQTNGTGNQIQSQPTGSKNVFDMSNIASSFAFGNNGNDATPKPDIKPLDPQATATSSFSGSSMFSAQPTGSSFSSTSTSLFGSGSSTFGSNSTPFNSGGSTSPFNTGSTSPFSSGSTTTPSLVPQVTGFGGSNVKPFKPTSSFGAELMDNFPGAKQDAPSLSFGSSLTSQPTGAFGGGLSSQPTGLGSQPTGLGSTMFGGGLSSQPTGAFNGSLLPQSTGLAGGANPFRTSTFNNLGNGPTPTSTGNNPFPSSTPTGSGQQQTQQHSFSLI
ncbi:ENTH domain-containing protein C19F8,03c OS=Schizosaccharomyces pombe (strain 972 / ATCC 24843) GN=SPBC19F8.03c PE=1 SV=1 [Rhizoctonia solani AG-1 IB]|uniref:ENTH domain-containing protein C19F8,03c n=1 Tax=Thanatephorus cucumeris (strain AG1-IB / isolate 7/3/14) TaxID=1108050 RepID=A0A0B7FXY8_THACB|nr:ENTH domain-containing protein C19F8,03c OS=Schizosaccharomyces pombe (strain 972 / ATCC 24843) GN=SPBC19F8.03c PE=1 SV=1 [Rhizoctonia solani AG-1 IB]